MAVYENGVETPSINGKIKNPLFTELDNVLNMVCCGAVEVSSTEVPITSCYLNNDRVVITIKTATQLSVEQHMPVHFTDINEADRRSQKTGTFDKITPSSYIPRLNLPRFPRGNRLRWLRRFTRDWQVSIEAPLSWLEALYEFTQNTTFHGIRYVFDVENTLIRRILWLAIIIACAYGFFFVMAQRLAYYGSNPTADNREIRYVDEMPFPAVTICNHNLFRISKAAEKGVYEPLTGLFDRSALKDSGGNASLLHLDSFKNITDALTQLSHQKDRMIFACKWAGQECGPEDFDTMVTDQGLCFTFNGNPNHILDSKHAGPTYGLSLVLNVEQYEYMAGPSNTAGIKVIIHNQTEVIDIQEAGIDVPPGFQASVGTSVTQIKSDSPGNECGATELRYYKGYEYTSGACAAECESDFIEDFCGCHRVQIPIPEEDINSTLPICDLRLTWQCVVPAVEQQKSGISLNDPESTTGRNFTFKCNTSCPESCQSSVYTPVMSYAALSRYNAEKILEQEPEKISAIQSNFFTALELSSRNDNNKKKEAKQLFAKIDEIYQKLVFQKMIPDVSLLKILQQEIFNATCFENAQNIVTAYENLTYNGIQTLKRLDLLSYERSLFINNYLMFLAQMRIENMNFEAMLRTQLGSSAEETRLLSREVEMERLKEVGTVEAIMEDINSGLRNYYSFLDEHTYLLNITEYAEFTADLPQFQTSISRCLSNLRSSIDRQLTQLRNQISGGRGNMGSVRQILAGLGEQRIRCERILVHYSQYNRDNWFRRYEGMIVKIDTLTQEKFKTFRKSLDGIYNYDFQTSASEGVYDEVRFMNSLYRRNKVTKLELAGNLTLESFQDNINTFLQFIDNTHNYLYRVQDEITVFLDEFKVLNAEVPPVVRELYKTDDPTNYRLYFEGNLFTEAEVDHCKSVIGGIIRIKQTEATSLRSRFFFAWRALRDHLQDYKSRSLLNADFVLTNFAQLSIFFRDLRFENVEKTPAYGIFGLISDLGGSCGLYFGASFLSIAELIDIFFWTAYKKIQYKRFTSRMEKIATRDFVLSKL